MLDRLSGFFTSVGAAIVALAFAFYLGGSSSRKKAEQNKMIDELSALKQRSAIDDSLRDETDLHSRASRAGVLRRD